MDTQTIEIDGEDARIDCAADETILFAALRAGLGFPYECSSGTCGRCRFQALAGTFVADWPEAPGLSPRDRAKGDRHLACQTRATAPGRIRVRLDPARRPVVPPRRHDARLVATRRITATMSEFAFMTRDAASFRPGQYALLRLPEVVGARAYSMANLPNGDGDWRFVIKRVPGGAASRRLFEQRASTIATLEGPFGHAYLRAPSERRVLGIAGGSGLSPMLSIMRGALRSDGVPPAPLLYYGARNSAEIFPVEAFPDLGLALSGRLEIRTALSDPGEHESWDGLRGPIHEVVERELGPALGAFEIYAAGPSPMVCATLDMLARNGVDPQRIHYDSFT